MKRTIKITGKIVLILLAALLIFSVATYIVHYVKTKAHIFSCRIPLEVHMRHIGAVNIQKKLKLLFLLTVPN